MPWRLSFGMVGLLNSDIVSVLCFVFDGMLVLFLKCKLPNRPYLFIKFGIPLLEFAL